jgi:hypothetical protein
MRTGPERDGEEVSSPTFDREQLLDEVIAEVRQGRLHIGAGVAAEDGNRFVRRDERAGQVLGHTVEIAQLVGLTLLQRNRVGEARIVSLRNHRRNNRDGRFVFGGDERELAGVQFGHVRENISETLHDVLGAEGLRLNAEKTIGRVSDFADPVDGDRLIGDHVNAFLFDQVVGVAEVSVFGQGDQHAHRAWDRGGLGKVQAGYLDGDDGAGIPRYG